MPGVPSAVAAIKLTNAHASNEQLAMFLTNFVFIIVVSFCLIFLFWPSLAPRHGEVISGRSPMYRTETSARLR
jgi:hypothetical protein